ncbi:hypothetical protein WJX82_007269 [Trebouxia sp. C0006]
MWCVATVVLSAVAFGPAVDMGPMAFAEIARLSQVMTAAIMPKAFKAGFMVFALLTTLVTFTAADCPDAGIRCRIPASDADTTGSSSGCSGGGSASGGAMEDVPTGMISINGMCYTSETDSDQTTFAVIGDITIGQCYDALQEQH